MGNAVYSWNAKFLPYSLNFNLNKRRAHLKSNPLTSTADELFECI